MKQKVFTVIGKFSFPIDMLRYDCCYPADQESVIQIMNSQNIGTNNVFKVNLISDRSPTKNRWSSFLWKVL